MNRRRHTLLALLLLALGATMLPAQALSEPWRQKLRAAYPAPDDTPFDEWFAGLNAADDATRERTVALAIGLLRQALADQESDPSAWQAVEEWPAAEEWRFRPRGTLDTPPNTFRDRLLSALTARRYGTAAIPILRWATRNEPDGLVQHEILLRLSTPTGAEWDALLVEAATHAENTGLQFQALEQVVTRGLPVEAGPLDRLAHHFAEEIRVLARKHAKRLGHPESAPLDRVRCAQSPAIRALFARAERHVPFLPPADARFVVATLDYRPPDWDDEDGEPPVRIVRGWLLADDDDAWTMFTPYGERLVVQKRSTTYAAVVQPRTISAEIEWVGRERLKKSNPDAPVDFRDSPIYEFMIAAWLRRQGRHEQVARLLLPSLSVYRHGWTDPACFVRDLLGPRWVAQMMHAFASRDRARTQRLARELVGCFPRSNYHPVALRVLRELERHPDDFRTLTLPTPDAWAAMAAKMTRPDRIRYLLERLRLITNSESAYRIGSSRAVFPDGPQYADVTGVGPVHPFGFAAPIRWRGEQRINPFEELVGREEDDSDGRVGGLSLTVADIPTIAPFLFDDGLMRWVRLWSGLRWMELLPVRLAAMEVLDLAAGFVVLDHDAFDALTAPQQRTEVARLIEWARLNHARPAPERRLAFVASAADAGRPYAWPLTDAVDAVVKERTPGAAEVLARWLDAAAHEPRQRTALLRTVAQLDGKLAAKRAVQFADDASDYVRLISALVRFEHGDARAGLATIERWLRGLSAGSTDVIDGVELRTTIKILLAKKTVDANRVAAIALEGDWLGARFEEYCAEILRDFFAAGLPDAYRYCARRLVRSPPLARRKFAHELVSEIAKDRVPTSVYDRTHSAPLFTKLILWCLHEADRLSAARPR